MRVVDNINESLEYIRYPEYFFPITLFCVGGGLSAFGLKQYFSDGFEIYQGMMIAGGMGLLVWSFVQFTILWDNRG
tara:strand:- start:1682 stop:1909 length:228 start_codon:yes stop_codon:yes gene_type:complete